MAALVLNITLAVGSLTIHLWLPVYMLRGLVRWVEVLQHLVDPLHSTRLMVRFGMIELSLKMNLNFYIFKYIVGSSVTSGQSMGVCSETEWNCRRRA